MLPPHLFATLEVAAEVELDLGNLGVLLLIADHHGVLLLIADHHCYQHQESKQQSTDHLLRNLPISHLRRQSTLL